jgi:hypothetical protein
MSMASYISDITWGMISNAGIDIELVDLQPTPDGGDEYIFISDDTKVAFGPATTEQGNPAIGWDIATYESESYGEGIYWHQTNQDHAPTAAQALELVAAAVA